MITNSSSRTTNMIIITSSTKIIAIITIKIRINQATTITIHISSQYNNLLFSNLITQGLKTYGTMVSRNSLMTIHLMEEAKHHNPKKKN